MSNSQVLGGGGAGIKSIQRGSITLASVASNTATITAVDTANSIIRFLGATCSSAVTDASAYARVQLTNSTTVTALLNTSTGGNTVVVSFEVIEWYPGVIKSVQRGNVALAGVNPVTGTISSVDVTKAECHSLGFTTSNAGNATTVFTSLELTNATTLTARSTGTSANQTIGYQVVEWY